MAGPSLGDQAGAAYRDAEKTAAEWAASAQKRLEQAAKDSFDWTQAKLDVITAKAAEGEKTASITMGEKAFLFALYHALGAGGWMAGMPEASLLIRTYVRAIPPLWGEPNAVDIGSQIYETSPGVKREMERQIQLARKHFRASPRSTSFPQRSGKMIAEQNNRRMFYADNRFKITSVTSLIAGGYETTFRVDNRYDFEPFQGGANWMNVSKWSKFPFKGNKLIIYDGLSHYLTVLNIAREFNYFAKWTRVWK